MGAAVGQTVGLKRTNFTRSPTPSRNSFTDGTQEMHASNCKIKMRVARTRTNAFRYSEESVLANFQQTCF